MDLDDYAYGPIRWKTGEAIYRNYPALPGLFVFVYAAVVGAKWLGHFAMIAWRRLRAA